MEKEPVKPIEPNPKDFPIHIVGRMRTKPEFIKAYQKYQKDLDEYKQNLQTWNQLKFIKDIKRSTEKLCLKKYLIIKL